MGSAGIPTFRFCDGNEEEEWFCSVEFWVGDNEENEQVFLLFLPQC